MLHSSMPPSAQARRIARDAPRHALPEQFRPSLRRQQPPLVNRLIDALHKFSREIRVRQQDRGEVARLHLDGPSASSQHLPTLARGQDSDRSGGFLQLGDARAHDGIR